MGYRVPTAAATVINASATLATETILTTTAPLVLVSDFGLVLIMWYLTLTIGATGTAVTIRIRQGATLGGNVLNVATPVTVTAGNTFVFSGNLGDSRVAQGPVQYSLTAQVTAATANSATGELFHLALSL